MKLFQPCETCKKRRWIIKKRKIILPNGLEAMSQKLMCEICQRAIQKAINKNNG